MPETVTPPPATPPAAPAAPAPDAAALAAAAVAAPTTTPPAAAPAAAVPAMSVVPETYDLTLPADSKVDPAVVERTAAIARELGLSNAAGQKLLEQRVADITAQTEAAETARTALIEAWKPDGAEFKKRDAAWRTEAQADAEIGGSPEKFAVSVEKAQQALTKYGPELKTYLDETGLGSHPAALKFLARIGRAMSEGALVTGTPANPAKPKSDAEVLYPAHYQTGRP